MSVIQLDEVDSTNKYALENFSSIPSGTLVVATSQTAGRGRRGKSWISPAGVNVYASYLIKDFSAPVGEASWIASLALLDFFKTVAPTVECWLKWPNDLFCGDKKIAGVLCDVKTSASNEIKGVVLGMGVNINMPNDVLAEIEQPATSILAETGKVLELEPLSELLAKCLERFYKVAQNESLYVDWKKENKLLGKEIEIRTESQDIIYGIATDIGLNGALIVQTESGLEQYHSGDVSVRKK